MDVVYPLKVHTPSGYQELRYSLRTLRNLPHGRVFLIGGCPSWAKNVVHIPTDQRFRKYQNLCLNIETACKADFISDPFIIMNDDFMVMQPVGQVEPFWKSTLDEAIERYAKRPGMANWHAGMLDVQAECERRGIQDPLSYELHVPMVVHKAAMLEALQAIPHGPVWRTIYGNLVGYGGVKRQDIKIADKARDLPESEYVSTEDDSFVFGKAGKKIRDRFKAKSPYEI